MKHLTDMILDHVKRDAFPKVFSPSDLAILPADRNAVDQALFRLVRRNALIRPARGLYAVPVISSLTGRIRPASSRDVVDAIARRDGFRYILSPMTAANEIGLTTAVPARFEVLCNSHSRTVRLIDPATGSETTSSIRLQESSAKLIAWADEPAMPFMCGLLHFADRFREDQGDAVLTAMDTVLDRLSDDDRVMIVDSMERCLSHAPSWLVPIVRDIMERHAPAQQMELRQ